MTYATFDSTDYARSHGKLPRGTGVWAFSPNSTGEWVFSPTMSYSAAKRWAQEQHPEARLFTVGP